ncbi:MAG: glycosyltransferase [Mycobacterium sp.]|nr:glycosyltransferase [Mycobacterium sp.]
MNVDFTIVIPTIGRKSLRAVFIALAAGDGPMPTEIIVVDDRTESVPLQPFSEGLRTRTLRSGGRGPAAARNRGWRAARSRWVCFLDDDVIPYPTWARDLVRDLRQAETAGAAGSRGRLLVPDTGDGPPSGLRLASARGTTADMAYRRDVLVEVGGFDERFPRAYREDSDLAARIVAAGHRICQGRRVCVRPTAPTTWFSGVRSQIGNRDDTIIDDVPYLNDPDRVRPKGSVRNALR